MNPKLADSLRVLAAEAKARIAIYGSRKVVLSLVQFMRAGGSIQTPEQERACVTLCSKMREDSASGKEQVSEDDMSCLLFDPKPPSSELAP